MLNLKGKILTVVLSVMVLITGVIATTTSIYAAGEGQQIDVSGGGSGELAVFDDMTKVTGTWDGGKARQFDGNKLVISNDVSGNITGLAVTNVPAGVYKVGYFLDIIAIESSDNPPTAETLPGIQDYRFRANPYGTYSNNPYFPCEFDGVEYQGLSTVVGKKIMIVVVIKVNQQENEIGLIAWPRSGYMDATLDKIVFASADHDFSPKNYPGYELFKEAAPEEGDNSKKPAEDEWTPSTNEQPGTGEPGTEPITETGDMSLYMIIALAGISVAGIFMLKNKKVTE